MVALKRVLCPVDLTELSIGTLTYAGSIAEWYGSNLTVLHVVPTFEPMEVRAGALFDPVQFMYPMTQEQIEERLRQVMRAADVPVDGACVTAKAGEPAPVIVNEALAAETDLVVMATHGRTGWDCLMLGSVTEKVLRSAPCSVFTVPPSMAKTPARTAMSTILCAVDFSPAALQAAEIAIDVANRARASVTFLHVIEWLAEEEARETTHFAVPEFRQHLTQSAREQLAALIARQPRLERDIRPEVTAGRAHRQITRVASDLRADLIVLGTHGRGGPPVAALARPPSKSCARLPVPY